jgi:hypothetical protein
MRYLPPDSPALLVDDENQLHARIADALRTMVGLHGPQRPGTLTSSIEGSLRGIRTRPSATQVGREIRRVLARLVDDGDLVRGDDTGDDALHARPLGLVRGAAGRRLLVGACLKTEAQVAAAAGTGLRRLGHRRWLDQNVQLPEDVSPPELGRDIWVRAPAPLDLDRALEAAACILDDQPALGPLDGIYWLHPGGARWARAEEAPAGLHVLRRETQWGQRRWYLVRFDAGGQAGPALQLPSPQLPAGDTAYGQGATLHLLLSARGGQSCSWRLFEDHVIELSALPPPWLGRQLDLLGDRSGGRRWCLAPGQRTQFESIMVSAKYSSHP